MPTADDHPDDDWPDDRRERRRRPSRDEDYDDEDGDNRPRRRRRPSGVEASEFIIPTGVSGFSIAACYFGLVSCFLPFIGVVLALIALPCGIIALFRKKRTDSYGSVTSDVRAIIGVCLSSLTLLAHAGILAFRLTRG
jgi:hypothetical protein